MNPDPDFTAVSFNSDQHLISSNNNYYYLVKHTGHENKRDKSPKMKSFDIQTNSSN